MQKVIISVITLLLLSGCTVFPGVHKIDVQQGNVVTQEMISELRLGMTPSQVRFVLGSPILVDTFHPQRWDYIYTMQKGKGAYTQKQLVLLFEQQRLSAINDDFSPQPQPPQ